MSEIFRLYIHSCTLRGIKAKGKVEEMVNYGDLLIIDEYTVVFPTSENPHLFFIFCFVFYELSIAICFRAGVIHNIPASELIKKFCRLKCCCCRDNLAICYSRKNIS